MLIVFTLRLSRGRNKKKKKSRPQAVYDDSLIVVSVVSLFLPEPYKKRITGGETEIGNGIARGGIDALVAYRQRNRFGGAN